MISWRCALYRSRLTTRGSENSQVRSSTPIVIFKLERCVRTVHVCVCTGMKCTVLYVRARSWWLACEGDRESNDIVYFIRTIFLRTSALERATRTAHTSSPSPSFNRILTDLWSRGYLSLDLGGTVGNCVVTAEKFAAITCSDSQKLCVTKSCRANCSGGFSEVKIIEN